MVSVLNDQALGLSACINFAYIGEQDITDYEGTGETSLDGFTVADLSVTKTLASLDKYGDVSLKVDVRNLFDEDYAYNQGYIMPGRSFLCQLEISLLTDRNSGRPEAFRSQ